MRTFVRVVDEGSFAGASRRLGLNQAVVTRLVADLEEHLGTRLLHRTTRSLSLTDAGDRYLLRCRQILAEVENAEEEVAAGDQGIRGRVRIAVPSLFGMEVMAPRLAKARALFPDVWHDIMLLDRPVDLVNEGFDLAVVHSIFGIQSSMVARPLSSKPIWLCASREYLARAGTPETPEDLPRHACIGYLPGPGPEQLKLFRENGETRNVAVNYVLQTNNMNLAHYAAMAGLGIGILINYGPRPELESGQLVRVLPEWHVGMLELFVVYPSRQHLPRRIRAIIDFMLDERDQMIASEAARPSLDAPGRNAIPCR